jgi:hypothetical protein
VNVCRSTGRSSRVVAGELVVMSALPHSALIVLMLTAEVNAEAAQQNVVGFGERQILI